MSCCATSELRRARPLLGTLVELAVRGRDRSVLEAAVAAGFPECAEIHALMSFHEPCSDVTRINAGAAAAPVPVDARTWRVLERAREISEASAGAFDVTVAPALVASGVLPRPGGVEASDVHG